MDGDVHLFHTPDGGDIELEGGQISLSPGIETMIYLSLFGGNSEDDGTQDNPVAWWGNVDETIESRKLISRTQHIIDGLPASPANLLKINEAIRQDLKPMLEERIISDLDVQSRIPETKKIALTISGIADGLEFSFSFTENWKRESSSAKINLDEIVFSTLPPAQFRVVWSDLTFDFQFVDPLNPAEPLKALTADSAGNVTIAGGRLQRLPFAEIGWSFTGSIFPGGREPVVSDVAASVGGPSTGHVILDTSIPELFSECYCWCSF